MNSLQPSAWYPSPKPHWECIETGLSPVSLDLVKEHLRMTHNEEDRVLKALTECATQQWEEKHKISLRPQKWKGVVKTNVFPMRLPRWHTQEITVTSLSKSQELPWTLQGPIHLLVQTPLGTWAQILCKLEGTVLSGVVEVEILKTIERLYHG